MNQSDQLRTLRAVLDEARPVLYGGERSTVDDLLDLGELRVATEILCENLCDSAFPLTPAKRSELLSVVHSLGLTTPYDQFLPA